jgi:GWxTD domain-containing protein
MKKLIIIAFVYFYYSVLLFSADLNMHIQAVRYLDEDFNTKYEIVYEIPYSSLKFVATDYGYGAQVDVNYVIKKDEKEHPGNFSNNIILTDYYRTVSEDAFLDKIVITLAKPGYEIEILFKDVLKQTERKWNYQLVQLNPDVLISDIEISGKIIPDSTKYLEKFHRDGKIFLVNTSNIFQKKSHLNLYLYFEIYSFFLGQSMIHETISIYQKNNLVQSTETEYDMNKPIKSVIREIDLTNLEAGLYKIIVEIKKDSQIEKKEAFFSIKSDYVKILRFFDSDEKDFDFVKLFLNTNEKTTFTNLDYQSKLFFIDRFWRAKETAWNSEGQIVTIIMDRLNYVNQNFSSLKTEGWKTDRGRIYLKYGEPDEIVKLNTNMYDSDIMQENPQVRYTNLGSKDFHIWKYRTGQRKTFIFLDSHSNKLFRLIYAGDDDSEITNPSWKSLIGGDSFDESYLN